MPAQPLTDKPETNALPCASDKQSEKFSFTPQTNLTVKKPATPLPVPKAPVTPTKKVTKAPCVNEKCSHSKSEASKVGHNQIAEGRRGSIKVFNSAVIEAESSPIACTCPNGHCLKKYCVCLKQGVACNDRCQCTDCENDSRPEAQRRRMEQISKIKNGVPKRGCNCKKNQCKLNYCVCYA